eukprot:691468-Amphidinium_carterae.1
MTAHTRTRWEEQFASYLRFGIAGPPFGPLCLGSARPPPGGTASAGLQPWIRSDRHKTKDSQLPLCGFETTREAQSERHV